MLSRAGFDQPDTKGEAGGKHPIGKHAWRSPERSHSEASRKAMRKNLTKPRGELSFSLGGLWRGRRGGGACARGTPRGSVYRMGSAGWDGEPSGDFFRDCFCASAGFLRPRGAGQHLCERLGRTGPSSRIFAEPTDSASRSSLVIEGRRGCLASSGIGGLPTNWRRS
jgi:hypothetical protein